MMQQQAASVQQVALAEPPNVETAPAATVTTSRVVSGGLWSLGWQVATLGASLAATPFVIRALGPAQYGVLALVNVLIGYASVSDIGMGQASTKFGAEAYGRNDRQAEAAVVWTSLLVLLVPAALSSLLLLAATGWMTDHLLHVPADLHRATMWALRLAAGALTLRSLSGVLNTPHLVRLRLDLVTGITNAGALVQIILVPLVLWGLGAGLAGAVAVTAAVAVVVAAAHALVAWRLLPELAHPRLDRAAVRPMVRYGSSTALIMLVAIVLMNAEKFLIAGLSSAGALAFYAVAFTLARLLVVVPGAFGQVLLPAFAQLQVATDRQPLQLLYVRSLRLLLLINLPLAAVLAFSARPVITVWAGSEYGVRSAVPLAALALGCLIDGLSYVPRVMLESVGRPDLIARYLMLTLVPYIVAAAALIHWWGITGAAIAWTGRAAVEWALMFAAARKIGGISVHRLVHAPLAFVAALIALLVPAVLSPWISGSLGVTVLVSFLSVACYAVVTWTLELTTDERGWITAYGGRFLQPTVS